MPVSCRRATLAAVLLALGASPLAADETTHCNTFITSLPYTITVQGHYCLDRNLTAPLNTGGIKIDSDFVWLDLNGFKIGHGTQDNDEAIHLFNHHHNITIRNGLIRRFEAVVGSPVAIEGAGDQVTIEDVAIDDAGSGIKLTGAGNVVRRCRLHMMQNLLPFSAWGIWLDGGSAVVSDNVVADVQAGCYAPHGIRVTGPGGFVSNNDVTAVADSFGCPGPGTGIFLEDPSSVYRNNIVTKTSVPYSGGTGADNYP